MSQSHVKTLAGLNLTAAGTGQKLSATSLICQTVVINAKEGNAGAIYIGDSNVASDRYMHKLAPGEQCTITGDSLGGAQDLDLSEIYFDGDTTNDDIYVGYLERSN